MSERVGLEMKTLEGCPQAGHGETASAEPLITRPANENESRTRVIDGNHAAAHVAYRASEVIAIYPITPSSPMAEWADTWADRGIANVWGSTPLIQQMQSEGGVAGVLHGALQTGSLATTFTCSQGLLLMIPDLYRIVGELSPLVIHVAARALATHALSIFGDHSDVMAARATGAAMLASGTPQEAMDLAAVAHAAALQARLPFLHFFDGFRTSHEFSRVEILEEALIRSLMDPQAIRQFRERALSPEHPFMRGTAQNPDVFFQGREAAEPFFEACPRIVQQQMDRLAQATGRAYRLFDYFGPADAERVIVMMGSGAEAAREAVEILAARGEKVGLVQVRLFRPFSAAALRNVLPRTARALAVLDRVKEAGAVGEPLYLDVLAALQETSSAGAGLPSLAGGRYGLGSKEFTPTMAKAVLDELARTSPRRHFTVGIEDDVSYTSLRTDPGFSAEREDVMRAVFYGVGGDGTISASKNAIEILGRNPACYVQGYFEYDSKKSGSITVSNLRIGPDPIHSTYRVRDAAFVGCCHFSLLSRCDILDRAAGRAILLVNSPCPPAQLWEKLPPGVRSTIIEKDIRLYAVEAERIARELDLGPHIGMIMQSCFLALTELLPANQVVLDMQAAVAASYSRKGDDVLARNCRAIEAAVSGVQRVERGTPQRKGELAGAAPSAGGAEAGRDLTRLLLQGRGDEIPVSAFQPDGTFPVGTARLEKRALAESIPVWEPDVCIQCGKCAVVCPHSAIRIKVFAESLPDVPATLKQVGARDREWKDQRYTIQVAPDDCTGCALCAAVCPAIADGRQALHLESLAPLRDVERRNWDFFLGIPEVDRGLVRQRVLRQAALLEPLFEFPGACGGCGETPYLKLLSQLFGDRAMIANATGCSSIYGGNLPTTPWCQNAQGRGPAWSNSLFEDNAEFGLGFRLASDQQQKTARELLQVLRLQVGASLADEILETTQKDEPEIFRQRERVRTLKGRLSSIDSDAARALLALADALCRRSIWIVGGDGWAYDIGFGGLDHVLASGRDVNVLVLDTGVYSNTGGQASKATPRGAVAKFAAGGRLERKKDLALMAMSYGNVYVASVALGAKDEQTLRAFLDAEAFAGPSLILAYSHCIAHGIEMSDGLRQQKAAVLSGSWPLFRYNPALKASGGKVLQMDSPEPRLPLDDYMYSEGRFRQLMRRRPSEARHLLELARQDAAERRELLQRMAGEQDPSAHSNPSNS